ncbi:OmpA family protein [Seohaeicola nanhaiensis]|uniref:OmpA family protein n=1 Tax=Seohaeicola nanhaiensis TaxID=1387282 RepID=A0ABV9KFQ1_9RHOB
MKLRFAACLVIGLAPLPGAAAELQLAPGARQLTERINPADSYDLPTGPFADGTVPTRHYEGRVERLAWRIDTPGMTTLQLLAPLRAQLEAQGYKIVFECDERSCGGFDFRFRTEVVPAPDMYVDIRNYRFLAATRGETEALSLLVSRSRSAGYVQIVRVNPDPGTEPEATEAPPPEAATPEDLGDRLLAQGHAVLGDLVFDTGADALDPGTYDSLRRLSEFLAAHPDMMVAVVGHTDSIGALDQNISLSKRRAESVRDRLIKTWGVAPERIQAEGMGYLAPIASNLTPEGREENRRVEVILLRQGG